MAEIFYRIVMFLAFLGLLAIRIRSQRKVLHEQRKIQVSENQLSLAAGAVAALTSLVFGAEYVFFRGIFQFAYPLEFPDWTRWLGVVLLGGGIALLGRAHHHLDRSFHSFVVSKEDQRLVTTGPYRLVRHPIYTAYLMSYLGGGLVSANLVLLVVPVTFFSLMIINRIPREEALMREEFGEAYQAMERRTGRLLPKISRNRAGSDDDGN